MNTAFPPSSDLLKDQVILVTGAASGIGRATAMLAAQAGARVMLADWSSDTGEALAAELGEKGFEVAFQSCDVSQPGQVQALVDATLQQFGRIDVLVNNTGIPGASRPAHELDPEEFGRVLAVNLQGPFLCARAAIPHFLIQGGGVIVNVASTYGLIGAPRASAYCASKGGVIALTRQLAVDYGPHSVRVNAVAPGYVDTDMSGNRARLPEAQRLAAQQAREANAARQPLGRQAAPTEIARAILFLASPDSSFMTGSIVTVDGGCTATFNYNLA
ncbi:SDR family oxidoreductase [Deinococcus cavernae]|uniref:SDR family oxidoreductase n=1 Tax=Deinococcus cavernae TaxID=2320857 RepID=A0A418VGP4_9DEIO|nr:SDR family oxidoreductase [Deinococcus cavernae]RJF75288.1 SDR family oxidoreductase [Deinococcus cavernae]